MSRGQVVQFTNRLEQQNSSSNSGNSNEASDMYSIAALACITCVATMPIAEGDATACTTYELEYQFSPPNCTTENYADNNLTLSNLTHLDFDGLGMYNFKV